MECSVTSRDDARLGPVLPQHREDGRTAHHVAELACGHHNDGTECCWEPCRFTPHKAVEIAPGKEDEAVYFILHYGAVYKRIVKRERRGP